MGRQGARQGACHRHESLVDNRVFISTLSATLNECDVGENLDLWEVSHSVWL